ncbi:hypothetical protein [Spartinivicinus ruber]|nr:hypothetical protein [Spartinivicinus ruber]
MSSSSSNKMNKHVAMLEAGNKIAMDQLKKNLTAPVLPSLLR